MTWTDAAAGAAILIGLAGIVLPVIPGSLLILVAIIAWAAELQETAGWVVAGVATVALVAGAIVKFALPGKRLKATVPTRTLLIGALFAIAGFFAIPIVGALVGFPIGIYLAERHRVGAAGAWPSTKAALRAIGVSILVEFIAGLIAAAAFVVGVVAT